MSELDVRIVAFALAALASVWPPRRRTRLVLFAMSGMAIIGAAWSATFSARGQEWAIPVVVVLAIGLGWAVPILFRAFTTPMYPWVLFAACWGAIHLCVPETDHLTEVGVALACIGVAELLIRRRLPQPVWSAATAALLWSAVYGSSGQSRAIVGGLFAVVPFVAVAAIVLVNRTAAMSEARLWLVTTIWIAASWTVARTGGIADTAAAAWVSVAIASAIAVPLSVVIGHRQPVRA